MGVDVDSFAFRYGSVKFLIEISDISGYGAHINIVIFQNGTEFAGAV